jgi:hypothetical protein
MGICGARGIKHKTGAEVMIWLQVT